VGYFSDWLEPLFEQELYCLVIVTKRAAPVDDEPVTIGKQEGEHVYELFVTSHPARCLQAANVVQLYLHRGSFETVLADEDVDQDEGRWCSHTPCGQECWQIVSPWVWHLRLELGCVQQQPQLRHTRLVDDTVLSDTVMPAPAPPAIPEPVEEEVIENYGPLEMAKAWAKCRGRFSGKDFVLLDEGTLPSGQAAAVAQPGTPAQRQPAHLLFRQDRRLSQLCSGFPMHRGGGLWGQAPASQCHPQTPGAHAPSQSQTLAGTRSTAGSCARSPLRAGVV
jgi:hypothetical protein